MTISEKVNDGVWKTLPVRTKREILLEQRSIRCTNVETGEIMENYEPRLKVTEKQIFAMNAKQSLSDHEVEHGKFVFAFFSESASLSEKFPTLSQSDMARILFLATYTAWESGQLKHDNGVPLDKAALLKLTQLSRNKFSEFYKRVIGENILSEEGGGIYMNPSLFYKGRQSEIKELTAGLSYTRIFRNTVRDLYANYTGRKVKQLGVLYAVLPYVNFYHNVLSHNPSEATGELVEPLTIGELAEILDYDSPAKLTAALRAIKYQDKSVFGFFECDSDHRKKKIVVNPCLSYAGPADGLETLKILFK